MIKCEICNQEFKNNLGGDLTKHLKEFHDISLEDYYIRTKPNGVEPKCQCGYCNERPNLYRGKFQKFAMVGNHELQKFDYFLNFNKILTIFFTKNYEYYTIS